MEETNGGRGSQDPDPAALTLCTEQQHVQPRFMFAQVLLSCERDDLIVERSVHTKEVVSATKLKICKFKAWCNSRAQQSVFPTVNEARSLPSPPRHDSLRLHAPLNITAKSGYTSRTIWQQL